MIKTFLSAKSIKCERGFSIYRFIQSNTLPDLDGK